MSSRKGIGVYTPTAVVPVHRRRRVQGRWIWKTMRWIWLRMQRIWRRRELRRGRVRAAAAGERAGDAEWIGFTFREGYMMSTTHPDAFVGPPNLYGPNSKFLRAKFQIFTSSGIPKSSPTSKTFGFFKPSKHGLSCSLLPTYRSRAMALRASST
jgi:hypothetical protein